MQLRVLVNKRERRQIGLKGANDELNGLNVTSNGFIKKQTFFFRRTGGTLMIKNILKMDAIKM